MQAERGIKPHGQPIELAFVCRNQKACTHTAKRKPLQRRTGGNSAGRWPDHISMSCRNKMYARPTRIEMHVMQKPYRFRMALTTACLSSDLKGPMVEKETVHTGVIRCSCSSSASLVCKEARLAWQEGRQASLESAAGSEERKAIVSCISSDTFSSGCRDGDTRKTLPCLAMFMR